MKACFGIVAWFTLALLLGPTLAQEPPTEEPKPEPKVVEKTKKVVRPSEDFILQSMVLRAKIKEVREPDKEVVIYPIDPAKHQAYLQWDQSTQAGILKSRVIDPARVDRYKKDSAKKYDGIFAGEPRTIGVPETARVRTIFAPPQLDAKGNPRKNVDLIALRGNSRLPGYAASAGSLRAGQIVDVYLPKLKKAAPAAKTPQIGATAIADPAVGKIDALLIVVIQDGK